MGRRRRKVHCLLIEIIEPVMLCRQAHGRHHVLLRIGALLGGGVDRGGTGVDALGKGGCRWQVCVHSQSGSTGGRHLCLWMLLRKGRGMLMESCCLGLLLKAPEAQVVSQSCQAFSEPGCAAASVVLVSCTRYVTVPTLLQMMRSQTKTRSKLRNGTGFRVGEKGWEMKEKEDEEEMRGRSRKGQGLEREQSQRFNLHWES